MKYLFPLEKKQQKNKQLSSLCPLPIYFVKQRIRKGLHTAHWKGNKQSWQGKSAQLQH